jgi:hypothetical protein
MAQLFAAIEMEITEQKLHHPVFSALLFSVTIISSRVNDELEVSLRQLG